MCSSGEHPSRPALVLPLLESKADKDAEPTVAVDEDYRYLVMPARLPG